MKTKGDFISLEEAYPEIAKQWHPTKNGSLTPKDVSRGSNKKVWWLLPYDDPITGQHFDFEWEATINNRTLAKSKCPFLTSNAVWIGYNDLATKYPDLAKEWHPTKNGDLKPTDVTSKAKRKVWWFSRYEDHKTGKIFNFEWKASVFDRSRGRGCPYVSNKKVFSGFNDLKTCYPEIAAQWHPTKNGDLKPENILYGSQKKIWWRQIYYDEELKREFNLDWCAPVVERTFRGDGCPFLSGARLLVGFNDLQTRRPDLAKEWHPTKNGDLKPTDVASKSNRKVWWLIKYFDEKSNKWIKLEWQAKINNRVNKNSGCPYLAKSNGRALAGFNDLATTHPEIASEWHPTKNGSLNPTNVLANSNKKVWWQIEYDGTKYEWIASIDNRTKLGSGCPQLSGSYLELKICGILNKKQIAFVKEKKLNGCKTKRNRYYRFDLFVQSVGVIIEVDGNQHFKAIGKFGGTDGFLEQVDADNYKNTYAFENNLPILRIPYKYLTAESSIEQLITYFLETKRIPQEIIDFYSQFDFSNYVSCVEEYHKKLDVKDAA